MDTVKNPWTVVSEKTMYDNSWIRVNEFDVINPNGGAGIYGKVHFKNTAIGVLPLDSNLDTYLVGQYRFTLDAYSWEIPEGGGLSSEDPLDAAKRELVEETGLIAKEWNQLLVMHLSNSISDEYAVLFLARDLEQSIPTPDDTEKLTIRKLPFEEAFSMVEQGLITDAISVAVIQKVKLMLIQGKIK
jgi:8-oxo-dGTP pyrophosphatase MutT (NUDIX family)